MGIGARRDTGDSGGSERTSNAGTDGGGVKGNWEKGVGRNKECGHGGEGAEGRGDRKTL